MHALISLKALYAAACAASTEETRFYLNGVCVEVSARQVVYVATDGHVLFAYRELSPRESRTTILSGPGSFRARRSKPPSRRKAIRTARSSRASPASSASRSSRLTVQVSSSRRSTGPSRTGVASFPPKPSKTAY